jgi:hypothetical protein
MRLHLAAAHQMDAGEQRAEGVQERFDLAGLLEEPPLGVREPPVVVGVVAGQHARGERHQLGVRVRGVHHERRQQLFQDVSVAPEHQPHELAHVVRDEIHLDAVPVPHPGPGLLRFVQAQQLFDGQQMDPPQVHVRVPRRKPVQMRSGDGGEEQWVGLFGDDGTELHVQRISRRSSRVGQGISHGSRVPERAE